MNEIDMQSVIELFDFLDPMHQAEFLSKIKPKAGVGNALADMSNSISDKDFLAWVLEVEAEYQENFGPYDDSPDEDDGYEDYVDSVESDRRHGL